MGDSKGKKIWGWVRIANDFRWLIGWLLALPWGIKVVAVMTPLAILWLSILKSMPWEIFVFCVMAFIFLIFVFFTALFKVEKASEAPTAVLPVVDKTLNLLLTPHGDQTSLLTLEVTNKREPTNFTAQVRIISRSDNQPVDTSPYIGRWKPSVPPKFSRDYSQPPTLPRVKLETGLSKSLKIAEWERSGEDDAIMRLIGSDTWMMWDHKPTPQVQLPFFTLQIEFFGDGFDSVSRRYIVGPKHAYGPLRMTEVTT